jgi:hypothetical protein
VANGTSAVHVARIVRKYTDREGETREYASYLLRRSWREDGKIRHETLSNITALPDATIEVIRASLAGKALVVAGEAQPSNGPCRTGTWRRFGRGLARWACRGVAPGVRRTGPGHGVNRRSGGPPGSKLATTRWWAGTTLGVDLGVADAGTDGVYAAMDWVVARQGSIEKALAKRHLAPGGVVMFDLSSSWVEGAHCPVAARGYSRDRNAGKAQIEYDVTIPAGLGEAVARSHRVAASDDPWSAVGVGSGVFG